MHEALNLIINGIRKADPDSTEFARLYDAETGQAKNQFLFFIKPELIRGLSMQCVSDIFSFISDSITGFGMRVQSVVLLTGRYMDTYRIVSSHYGVIDEVTRNPKAFFPGKAEQAFTEIFEKNIRESDVCGGFELMDRLDISAEELAGIWLTGETRKLASGMYCEYLEDKDLFLINGFYPRMLRHFTRDDSIVVGLVLGTDRTWKEMRGSFLGATDPAKACAGSIRRGLLERKDCFGLDVVSSNYNGVHASAGPVEALVELVRFTSDLRQGGSPRKIEDFDFGRALVSRFGEQALTAILANEQLNYEGGLVSVFDLTEEIDSDTALERLSKVLW